MFSKPYTSFLQLLPQGLIIATAQLTLKGSFHPHSTHGLLVVTSKRASLDHRNCTAHVDSSNSPAPIPRLARRNFKACDVTFISPTLIARLDHPNCTAHAERIISPTPNPWPTRHNFKARDVTFISPTPIQWLDYLNCTAHVESFISPTPNQWHSRRNFKACDVTSFSPTPIPCDSIARYATSYSTVSITFTMKPKIDISATRLISSAGKWEFWPKFAFPPA